MNTTVADNLIRIYVSLVALVCLAGLVYVYAYPPSSMRINRDGISHFMPDVIHPETGETVPMGDLIRHFRGD